VGFGGDEGEGVDEFLGDQGDGKDDDGENAGGVDGNQELQKGAEASEAVHHGGVLEFPGNGLEEAHEQPDGKRNGEGGVNENQAPERILQAEKSDDPGKRDEEQRGRNEIGEEDGDAEALAPAAGEAGEG